MHHRFFGSVSFRAGRGGPDLRRLVLVLLVAVLIGAAVVPIAAAAPEQSNSAYVVKPGDTLATIAARLAVSVVDLARANGITNYDRIFIGQTLAIPGATEASSKPAATNPAMASTVATADNAATVSTTAPASTEANASASAVASAAATVNTDVTVSTEAAAAAAPTTGTYIVQKGDTLSKIAVRFGTTVANLMRLNGIANPDRIWIGQRLIVSGSSSGGSPRPPAPGPVSGRWIDVNLSTQRLTAFQGNRAVFSALISSGLPRTPTVTGRYKIYVKLRSTRMRGPGYDLPNVPYTMYFYKGYGIHGTYWHHNFGHPMSHGCVNMRTQDAAWLFGWAGIGTTVVTHY